MENTVAAAFEPIPLAAVLADYAELFKLRVNSLVVLHRGAARTWQWVIFRCQASSA